ncbi:carboxylesterase/lipase family protein [Nonomuraea sp. CA-143628]|uniref:carboxylesterase/lipase family protein n=1 Tax=Nonomuraea sp. CA-143628 TaxID=3239997 RepID=UPI003D8D9C79
MARRLLALVAGGCLAMSAGVTQAAASAGVTQAAAQEVPTPRPSIVQLDSGRIRGADDGTVRTYSGIRFAQPPVGRLRWKEPERVAPWRGVADATKPGRPCLQVEAGKQIGGEDCLFLDVTAPAKPSRGPLPVMVWLYGGGFLDGYGSIYNARRMADQGDVVVVTPNYRLGAFGFLSLPGLSGSGTFGLADQLEALKWVQRNAAAFGGDPDNVTLFGQSAGGISTCALLTSPATRGLIDKAVMQSGTCTLNWPNGTYLPIPSVGAIRPYHSLKSSWDMSLAAVKQLGCPAGKELDCLRDKPVSELMKVSESFGSNVAYGTPLLPLDPAQALRTGKFPRVPVISGGTKSEGNGFVAGAAQAGFPVTAENYPQLMKGAFGEQADKVLKEYPLTDFASPGLAWATLSSDRAWACPTLEGDKALAARTTVYAYEFADAKAPNVVGVPSDFPLGAQHASDLPYLFDLDGRAEDGFTPEQWRLAEQMIGYWTSFAHTGKPQVDGAPAWRAFTPSGQTVLSLKPASQGGVGPVDLSDEHRCAFWRGLDD